MDSAMKILFKLMILISANELKSKTGK